MSDDPPEPTAPPAEDPVEAAAPHVAPNAEPAEPTGPTEVTAVSKRRRFRRLAFLALPAIALLEVGAHLVQTHSIVQASDWLAARDAVRSMVQPEDFIAFAPYWTDPLGREFFGSDLATLAREARADDSRFRRGIEVSIRGKHLPELANWKAETSRRVGAVTVTVYDNPAYQPVLDDLVDHVAPDKMAVSELASGQETECPFMRGRVETGGLGFGPAVPAERFTCPGGGQIGASVMQPTDYRPHRCLFTPPLGSGKTLRVKFLDVQFGQTLRGHTAIDWDSEHHLEQPSVSLVWKVGNRTLARISDANGDGWKSFELNTSDLAGQTGELIAEVSSSSARDRLYCFEASTR